MERGRKILTRFLPLSLVFAFLLASAPLGSARGAQRDYIRFEIDYIPFDLDIEFSEASGFEPTGENSGSLTRGWVENRYELLVSETGTATRQVITQYVHEPTYSIWSHWTGTIPSRLDVDWDTYQMLKWGSPWSELESFWRSYFGLGYEPVTPNSFQSFKYGFQHFQGFCDWRRDRVKLDIWAHGTFYEYIWVPHQYRYLVHTGNRVVPVYGTEEYTIYKNTRYEILDYALDNWPTLQAKITLRWLNGYQGEVRLSVEADELLGASLADENLWVGSNASTTLTIAPAYGLRGSSHRLTIRATNGRLTRTAGYELDLRAEPKPPVENRILEQWESETKPDEVGQASWGPRLLPIGATGTLRDAYTNELVCGGNTVSAHINSNKEGTFDKTDRCSAYYSLIGWTWHEDEVWQMRITADVPHYKPQTKSATSSSGRTVTVDFYLLGGLFQL